MLNDYQNVTTDVVEERFHCSVIIIAGKVRVDFGHICTACLVDRRSSAYFVLKNSAIFFRSETKLIPGLAFATNYH